MAILGVSKYYAITIFNDKLSYPRD